MSKYARIPLTPKKYVDAVVKRYPSLYASSSYEHSKFAVFDQLFNVIGNGIRDNEELKNGFKCFIGVDTEDMSHYYDGTPLWVGWIYYRNSASAIYVWEHEKENHPEIKDWFLPDPRQGFKTPYPNFEKRYSLIWKTDFLKMAKHTPEWMDEALWFYETCRKFFEGDCSSYHYAYPKETPEKTKYEEKCFLDMMEKYDSNEAISKAYETEYTGDIVDFLKRRWTKEKARILEFINETIQLIKISI